MFTNTTAIMYDVSAGARVDNEGRPVSDAFRGTELPRAGHGHWR